MALVEHLHWNDKVDGSYPSAAAIFAFTRCMRYYPPCADMSPAAHGHVVPRVGCKKTLRRQVSRDADLTRCTRAKMFSLWQP